MLNKVVLATRNLGKVREMEAILSGVPLTVKSLKSYPDAPEVEEDGTTFLKMPSRRRGPSPNIRERLSSQTIRAFRWTP